MTRFEMLRLGLRVGGVFLFVAGLECMPVGYGVSPKRDLSAFNNIADTGSLVWLGIAMMLAGVLTLAGASFIPDR
jgi:hypothetical protein